MSGAAMAMGWIFVPSISALKIQSNALLLRVLLGCHVDSKSQTSTLPTRYIVWQVMDYLGA
jgi:hypothetical protein